MPEMNAWASYKANEVFLDYSRVRSITGDHSRGYDVQIQEYELNCLVNVTSCKKD
jgi:hypothetical protein